MSRRTFWAGVRAAVIAVFVARLGEHTTPGAIGFGIAVAAATSHKALLRLSFAALLVLVGLSCCIETLRSNVKPISPSAEGVALVTGASTGIGASIATELAKEGWNVVLTSRKRPLLDALAERLHATYSVNATVVADDLCDPASVARLVETLAKRKLRVDVLVNNAGVAHRGFFVDTPLERIQTMTSLNVDAATSLARLLAPPMAERGAGRIMFVSSMYGLSPGGPTTAVYAATKAYLLSLGRSLRLELAHRGVGVTVLAPGATTDTAFAAEMGAEGMLAHALPLGIHLNAAEVARQGVAALLAGRGGLVVPGWTNRIVYAGIVDGFLPRPVAGAIAALVIVPVGELVEAARGLLAREVRPLVSPIPAPPPPPPAKGTAGG